MTIKGGELSFDSDALAPRAAHPLKVAIVEALGWVGRPLSASDLTKLIDDERFGLSHVSYHLAKLAEAGTVEVARSRRLGGSTVRFYLLTAPPRPDAGPRR